MTEEVDKIRKLSIVNKSEASIEEVINAITYAVDGNQLVIEPKTEVSLGGFRMLALTYSVSPCNVKVNLIVRDEDE